MTDNITRQLEATKALHAAIEALFLDEEMNNQFLAGLAMTYAMIGREAWASAFAADFNDVEDFTRQNRKIYPHSSLAVELLKIAEQQYAKATP